ncbi:MAG: secondary thiamine-phosphate synthase enzyme YjbQ [Bacteroidetes bacterium]|nr:secondary thiamine-phosphate synthase enzyme YjbQ [Bacteroidota bacterium]MDA1119858.1 secondary thiamine-phosphate synthase enzyme YjbQ [Bacteroidota bacterium]
MKITTRSIELQTSGFTHIIDITPQLQELMLNDQFNEGFVLVSAIGSTTGITTIEYEPGLVKHDISEMLDKLAPYGVNYRHNKTWGDDNGAAHLRSSLVGTSQTFPFKDGKLLLGTWQQIVFIDFDTRPRSREIVVQIIGRP